MALENEDLPPEWATDCPMVLRTTSTSCTFTEPTKWQRFRKWASKKLHSAHGSDYEMFLNIETEGKYYFLPICVFPNCVACKVKYIWWNVFGKIKKAKPLRFENSEHLCSF